MIGKLSTCDCIIDTEESKLVSACEKHSGLEYSDVVSQHKKIQDDSITFLKLKRLKHRLFS